MSRITTHILDTAAGKPAEGVSAILEYYNGGRWEEVGKGITNNDGRIKDLVPHGQRTSNGAYRLTFDIKAYFSLGNIKTFYPKVIIEFEVSDDSHYHVPLLLSPFGYSTYRGS